MLRIRVVLTGGTIGSEASASGLGVGSVSEIRYGMIDGFPIRERIKNVEFFVSSHMNILSENMTFDYWNKLLEELRWTDLSAFNGIIITHGTDTLGFSAAMLSLMLAGINIPVVLVSSNYILSDERSNGQDNFNNAVYFIKNSKMTGVFVIYNENGVSRVHLGSRLRQCESLTDSFSSAGGVDFGMMRDREFFLNNHSFNPTENDISERAKGKGPLLYRINRLFPCVMLFSPYVGLDYCHINLTGNLRAVLLLLYHASTACVEPGCNSAAKFCRLCKKKGIDFFAAPSKKDDARYDSTLTLEESGCEFLKGITAEAAYAKLILAFSTEDLRLRRRIISEDIFFESIF